MLDLNYAFKQIVFRIGSSYYSVMASEILGVEKNLKVEALPKMPTHIDGVTFIRGKSHAVLNIANLFGIEDEMNFYIVIEGRTVLRVSDVLGLRDLESCVIETFQENELFVRKFTCPIQQIEINQLHLGYFYV